MNALRILSEIEAAGVKLLPLEGGLKLVAATGTITPAMLSDIKQHRAEIIDIVTRRIEVADWLKPCPVCAGNEFIQSTKGGYFCVVCQPRPPEEIKRRVNGQQPAYATADFCDKCGSNNYAGIVQGWLCLACGEVFESIGGSSGPDILQNGFLPITKQNKLT